MPSGIKGARNTKRKDFQQSDVNKPQPTAPIQVTAASATGSTLTLTFNGPVRLISTPGITTDVAGATPVTANLTNGNTLAILFSSSIAAATEVRIPYEEPAIRNASGGFVSTSTFPV